MESAKPPVLFIVGQLTRGGAEQQFYNLLTQLAPPVVVVALTQGDYWAEPIRALGHTLIELDRRGRGDLSRFTRLRRIIRQHRPDVVHIFIDGVTGLYGRIGALLAGHRCVVAGERSHPVHHPRWYRALLPLLNLGVAAVVPNSQAAADYLVQHRLAPRRKIHVIPNGIDPDAFESASPPATPPWPEAWADGVMAGMVGRVSYAKSPETLVALAAALRAQQSPVRFAWIGGGALLGETQALADTHGVTDTLYFTGERHDVPALLQALDLFVLTSRYEGASNAILEAMAAGLPCIVTDAGAARQLVVDGDTGFVVPVGDVDGLARQISVLADDPARRRAMGERARERVRHEFTIPVMADRYRALYRDLCP